MRRFIILVVVLFSSSSLYAADTVVAVMNFFNYGGPGLNYLSSSIPDSVSSSLADIRGIRVIERRELSTQLDEVVVEQAGAVDSENVERVGTLVNADVLILGSISGNPKSVVIKMKAVSVSTGDVLEQKVVRAPIETLFDYAVAEARLIGAVVSGQDVARISVYSNPSGATVYIDGIEVGTTPLERYSVLAGEHKVQVMRQGYRGYQEILTVGADTHRKLNPVLIEDQLIRRNDAGLGFYYLVPLNDEVRPTLLINPVFFNHTKDILQMGLEFAFALNQRHDMDLISPINTPFTMERQYDLIMFHACINVLPFRRLRTVVPKAGVAVGLVHLRDYRINQALDRGLELIINQTSFSLMGRVGVSFHASDFFGIFLEARYYLQPSKINRPIYVSQGLGSEMAQVSDSVRINYYAAGGGIKLAF